jgi:hypothetical protein
MFGFISISWLEIWGIITCSDTVDHYPNMFSFLKLLPKEELISYVH